MLGDHLLVFSHSLSTTFSTNLASVDDGQPVAAHSKQASLQQAMNQAVCHNHNNDRRHSLTLPQALRAPDDDDWAHLRCCSESPRAPSTMTVMMVHLPTSSRAPSTVMTGTATGSTPTPQPRTLRTPNNDNTTRGKGIPLTQLQAGCLVKSKSLFTSHLSRRICCSLHLRSLSSGQGD